MDGNEQRAMGADAIDSRTKILELREEVAQLQIEKRKGTEEQKVLEEELHSLNARVRSVIHMGHRLPAMEYKRVCDRQGALKKKLARVQREATRRNARIADLNGQLHAMERESAEERGVPSAVRMELDALYGACANAESACETLRARYAAFASDMTRVSSMRVMAAKFAEELGVVLKGLQSL